MPGVPVRPALLVLAVAFALATTALTLLVPTTLAGCARERRAPVTRWAWERPEDLRGLDGDVAFLAATVRVRAAAAVADAAAQPVLVQVVPRQQPLQVGPGARLTAVVRIEVAPGLAAGLDAAVRARIVAVARRAVAVRPADAPEVPALQLDYDARVSERPFYRALLAELHGALPATRLSITALASWCLRDRWFDDLDMIDEAVPMVFDLGPDRRRVRAALLAGADFGSPLCQRSLGVALDEPLPAHVLPGRRRWLWSRRPWGETR